MNKHLVFVSPFIAFLLTGLVPFLWKCSLALLGWARYRLQMSSSWHRVYGYGHGGLSDWVWVVQRAFHQHLWPGTDWWSLLLMGPIVFLVTGIIATIWYFYLVEAERGGQSGEK